LELRSQFEKFDKDKTKQKEINDEIGRKRQFAIMRANVGVEFEFEGSSSIPSIGVMDPFCYIPPSPDRQPKNRKNIKSYFTPSPIAANASQPSQTHPTLDTHWKKQYKDVAFEYIARWWFDVDIPFNAAYSLYYKPMWDVVAAAGKSFKGPGLHDLRGSLLQKEVSSIHEYLKDFRDSWARTGCTIMSHGWNDRRNNTIISFFVSCPQGTMFLKYVDASDKVKDANLLFQLLDEIVISVGEANVVQIITGNASLCSFW
jgi:hypothetical protein